MKLMGVDYGRRRIGLAVTDDSGQHIRGLAIVDRKSCPDPYPRLKSIIEQELPAILVVGVPLDRNDAETVMSLEIRNFAVKLEKVAGIPVHYVDESMLSKRAEELLRFRKKKVRRDKAAVDRLAACLILQRYNEEHRCNG